MKTVAKLEKRDSKSESENRQTGIAQIKRAKADVRAKTSFMSELNGREPLGRQKKGNDDGTGTAERVGSDYLRGG